MLSIIASLRLVLGLLCYQHTVRVYTIICCLFFFFLFAVCFVVISRFLLSLPLSTSWHTCLCIYCFNLALKDKIIFCLYLANNIYTFIHSQNDNINGVKQLRVFVLFISVSGVVWYSVRYVY